MNLRGAGFMKMKLFFQSNLEKRKGLNRQNLEDEVNAWLGENPNIKVIDIRQSASGGSYSPSSLSISIWYEAS
jgi:hypothetical protein